MKIAIPDSMDECVYFTNRSLANEKGGYTGKILCWARRAQCPKCKKGLMQKPVDSKTGKFKVRATEYVCLKCSYSEPKKEHEEKLFAEAHYTCPECDKQGEGRVPYARKTYQGVKAILFECEHCKVKLPVTKKLKDVKKKAGKKKAEEVNLDDEDDF
jgi:ssDNA-binding Zn-finger/Zn-ribbon topoisomerase 1